MNMQRWSRRAGLVVVLAAVVGTALAPGPAAHGQTGARGTIPNTNVNPFGANVFLHKEVEADKNNKTLDLAQEAHLGWVKQDFAWSDIEISGKGDFTDRRNGAEKSAWDKYDNIMKQAEDRKLKVVARISFAPDWAREAGSGANDAPKNYGDLADFIVALITHYKGRLGYVQVWNEPNLAYEWKQGGKVDPTAYTEMLKTVYPRAKQADPNVQILSAPMAITLENIETAGNLNELDYWDQMYKAGAKDFFDIVSANAYGLDQPPDAAPSKEVLNFRRVELLHAVMEANGDSNKAVWFNEYGWNASPTTLSQEEQLHWRRVEPDVQAQWTVDGIQYGLDHWPWAGVFFIWYFRQVGDIPQDQAEYYFRLVDPDFSVQPVYKAVRRAAGLYRGPGALVNDTPAAGTPAGGTTPTGGEAATPAATPAGVATDTPGAAAVPTNTPLPGVVPTPAVAPTATSGGSSDSGSALPLILGGVVVLLIIGAAAFFFMRRGSQA
jgi:hypothetical protein